MNALPFAGCYPLAANFWVPHQDQDLYPRSYGDLCATPESRECQDTRGKPWHATVVLHPSCELQEKEAPKGVQVARVHKLSAVSQRQQQEIIAGVSERDLVIRLARVNTAFLAGTPSDYPSHHDPMFADLRETVRVPSGSLIRLAPMSHDARLAVLRRDNYFRYRWALTLDQVTALERNRINNTRFDGPRPAWLA